MPLSEKSKQCIRAWDRENIRSLTCRVRTEEAELFKAYCAAHDTTVGEFLKKYVRKCNYEYGEELRKAEEEKEKKKAEDKAE
ncbi:MAG: hypothetical protein HDT25_11175 [Ruminococcus sp.]|nr:hypothetical protein [Ruminococcus sp.]